MTMPIRRTEYWAISIGQDAARLCLNKDDNGKKNGMLDQFEGQYCQVERNAESKRTGYWDSWNRVSIGWFTLLLFYIYYSMLKPIQTGLQAR